MFGPDHWNNLKVIVAGQSYQYFVLTLYSDARPASELLANDIGCCGSGDENRPSGDSSVGANKVAPGQFDDVLPTTAVAIPDKCDSSSLKKAKDAEISLTLVDGIECKGQGDGPATSVLAGVPTSEN